MDNLAAPYVFVVELRQGLQAGRTLTATVRSFITARPQDSFCVLLCEWHMAQQQGKKISRNHKLLNVYRSSLLDLMDMSLQGIGIIEALQALEKEFERLCLYDLDRHNDKLPFKLMIPLLLLQFPAVLLLILGPLIKQFLLEVGT
ncbi:MAG: hypothetical protein H6623_02330 [Bdellovibrionaceae bacterium]|nr:hypothetical protein [Pseudobdellovibrionaceae bacterium]